MGKTKIKTIEESGQELEKKAEGAVVNTTEVASKPEKKEKVSKRAKKKTASAPKVRGKKYQEALAQVDRVKKYPLKEAVELAQKTSYSKFPGIIEAHLNTGAKNLRGLVSLPHFAGKKLTILAFGPSAPSTSSGSLRINDETGLENVILGNDEILADIEKGKINFDVVVVTPDWMPKLAKAAKVLGPRGLMPNPKAGTITENLEKTIADLKAGKTEYKTEKDGMVIHLSVGKADQKLEEVTDNIKVLYNSIGKSKITKITLSSTMGPGVKMDLSTI